jgi:hypothetical protein
VHFPTRQRDTHPGGRYRRCRGFIQMEIIASVALTLALAGLLAVTILQYAAARRESDARRLLQATAAAELDRIRAGITAVPRGAPETPPATQPGEIVLNTTATAGTGPWQGMTCVRIVASKRIGLKRTVTVELATYIPAVQP